ncbi:MAG: glycosyltransferase family 4 protein [SAR202 cluster bacterium]|nr:glycosyltransferase family 4 protein [SAR202 cluster bacterium]|tara:strand:- start:633 stop:1787 length:1155 start_codon:yes stop_codon:yes gene_type:complete
MRIAQVSPYDFAHPGGVQRHIASLSRELQNRGHEVTILAPCTRDEPAVDVGDVELRTFGRSVPVPTAGSIARISVSVWHEWRLKSTLENEQFDIVHIHEPLMPMFALTASRFSPSTTIGTFHAYNEGRGRGYMLWKKVLNRGAIRLNGRIAVSEPAKQFANRYFKGDYTVIPNGLDVDRFSTPVQKPSVLKDDAINMLFVGRVNEPRKGLRYALGAYSLLKWEYPNLRLIVAGGGIPDRESYRIMGERSLDDVVFVGPVSDGELPGYYQNADIFLAPNTGQESFGFIIIEAMASSTPIVASDISGFASVMTNEKEGLMVPPKDEAAMSRAIKQLIENPGLRAQLSIGGRITVDQYRWDRVVDSVLSYYNQVQDRQPVPPAKYQG